MAQLERFFRDPLFALRLRAEGIAQRNGQTEQEKNASRGRAAEQRDELASPDHSITSSARASTPHEPVTNQRYKFTGEDQYHDQRRHWVR